MSDLKKTSASMHEAASGLRPMEYHTAKPLQQFKAQSHHLGALGSLLNATGEMREGMTTLAKLTKQLDEDRQAEAKLIGKVYDAFDLLEG